MTIKATEVRAKLWVLLEAGAHSSRVEGVTTGVIALEVLHHTGGHTSLEVDAPLHSIDFGGPDIIEITRATTHTTILVDEHLLPKAMGLGMTQTLVNTFERNR